jgi:23S rRNA-/tRNA-specific pseudouridylate synthase
LPATLNDKKIWTFADLAELESLEDLFDDPIDDPPSGPPPFGRGVRPMDGDVSGPMVGQIALSLVQALTGLPEGEAAALVEFGALWLGRRVAMDPAAELAPGPFRLNIPAYRPQVFYEINPARVVHSDGDLIVYYKEAGRPSQGVPSDARNNVLAAMERRTGLTLRLSHRLDAPTSGLLIIAVTRQAASRLGMAFKNGAVSKRYLALSAGPDPPWREKLLDAAIGKEGGRYQVAEDGLGLSARTKLTFLGRQGENMLFLAEPLTGRTHQIRLHMANEGYPIIGDSFYGGAPARRLMLRASGLRLTHPGHARTLVLGGPWPDGGSLSAP